ncbi:MAG: hypothetical protein GYA31_02375, partial [Parcubacteria group bacterium]|nr:hypothetical protein [Parcubacteria group bacterium]
MVKILDSRLRGNDKKRLRITIILFLGVFLIPLFAFAWSQDETLFINSDYDLNGRNQMEVQLLKTTNRLYFYVDKNWYQNFSQKSELDSKIYNLASDFEYKIYPNLVNLLGSEDNPGIDNDSRIVIVLEPLKDGYGGYIQSGDEYPKKVYPNSNQGQIIYLNSNLITKADSNFLDYELAHEFTHLITLKQKPDSQTWFYELMSEFAGQTIGVDTSQITKQRAQALMYSTEVNLLDWKNIDKDYGKIYLLALYLKEQFGNQIFADVLKYPSSDALVSFNEVLKRKGTSFDEIYLNWLITNLYNTCDNNSTKYCYQDPSLKNFSVMAYSYYLPPLPRSSLLVSDYLYPWGGKWEKLNGGTGIISIQFNIPNETMISKIPYLVENTSGRKSLYFIDFSKFNIQNIYIDGIGTNNIAIYFVPFLGNTNNTNKAYYFSWQATNMLKDSNNEQLLIESLQQRIEELKRQLAQLQMQVALQKTYQNNPSCSLFTSDLYYGMASNEVKCLHQFLANLGSDIYPEKLITGYFGPLTLAAVKRYQAMKGII